MTVLTNVFEQTILQSLDCIKGHMTNIDAAMISFRARSIGEGSTLATAQRDTKDKNAERHINTASKHIQQTKTEL